MRHGVRIGTGAFGPSPRYRPKEWVVLSVSGVARGASAEPEPLTSIETRAEFGVSGTVNGVGVRRVLG